MIKNFRLKFSLMLSVLCTFMTASNSWALIKSSNEKDPHFIQMEQISNDLFILKICKNENANSCQNLGQRAYTAAELKVVKNSLIANGAVHSAAGAVIVAAGVAIGSIVGQWAVLATSASTSMWSMVNVFFGQILGMATGGTGGFVTVAYTLNPINNFRAAKIVSVANLNQEIKVSARMNFLAALIDERLKQLDSDDAGATSEENLDMFNLPMMP